MSKYIAVEGCELAFRNPIATGNIVIDPINTKASSKGNKIYAGELKFTITGYTVGMFSQTTPLKGVIKGTAQFSTSEGEHLVLLGDASDTLTIVGKEDGEDTTKSDTVYVKDAGQNVAKST